MKNRVRHESVKIMEPSNFQQKKVKLQRLRHRLYIRQLTFISGQASSQACTCSICRQTDIVSRCLSVLCQAEEDGQKKVTEIRKLKALFKKFSDKTYLLVSFARITATESQELLRITEVAQSCFHLLLSWIWENKILSVLSITNTFYLLNTLYKGSYPFCTEQISSHRVNVTQF